MAFSFLSNSECKGLTESCRTESATLEPVPYSNAAVVGGHCLSDCEHNQLRVLLTIVSEGECLLFWCGFEFWEQSAVIGSHVWPKYKFLSIGINTQF